MHARSAVVAASAGCARRASRRRRGRVNLQGRIALVTGAGHRVGRALAVALGGQGMTVAVHYNSAEKEATDTVDLISKAGGKGHAFRADLSDPETPRSLLSAIA